MRVFVILMSALWDLADGADGRFAEKADIGAARRDTKEPELPYGCIASDSGRRLPDAMGQKRTPEANWDGRCERSRSFPGSAVSQQSFGVPRQLEPATALRVRAGDRDSVLS